MSATFTPYFEAQAHRDQADSDAYIRVRVPDRPRPDGYILVYLPNGTGLVVNSNHLLHLDAGPDRPGEPDGRTSTAEGTTGTVGDTPDQVREAVAQPFVHELLAEDRTRIQPTFQSSQPP